jgi:hypothetical protein
MSAFGALQAAATNVSSLSITSANSATICKILVTVRNSTAGALGTPVCSQRESLGADQTSLGLQLLFGIFAPQLDRRT